MEKLTHEASDEARKHKAKYRGLCQKLKKWTVVAEMALLRDALSELARFSLHLQHRQTSVTSVGKHMEIVLRALSAVKDVPGNSLTALFDEEVKVQTR